MTCDAASTLFKVRHLDADVTTASLSGLANWNKCFCEYARGAYPIVRHRNEC